jgi:hypothetical protein
MEINRRSLLENCLLGGTLSGFLGGPAARQALAQAELPSTSLNSDPPNSYEFWSQFVSSMQAPAGNTTRADAVDQTRRVDFLHNGANGLRFAYNIDDVELLDHAGDVAISINIGGCRFSKKDRETFANVQSAQLKVDVMQSRPILDILDTLAWTAIAAMVPAPGGKLPALEDLGFSPAATKNMVLPGGSGHWAVNVSMVRKESAFLSILKTLTTEVGKFAPVVGLPAISLVALESFCKLYGMLEQHTNFLLQSNPVEAFATVQARRAATTTQGMNLAPGDYVLVPQSQSKELAPLLSRLELKQGYLVEKGAASNQSLYDVALDTPPDITYITVNVGVQPVKTPSPTDPQPSSAPSAARATEPAKQDAGSSSGQAGEKTGGKKGSGKSK